MRTAKSLAPVPGGFGFPLGLVTGLLLVVGFIAAGATSQAIWPRIALVLAVAAVSATTTVCASLATASVHAALYAGFVVGQRGDLVLNARSAQFASVLVLVAIGDAALASGVRTAHSQHAERGRGPSEVGRGTAPTLRPGVARPVSSEVASLPAVSGRARGTGSLSAVRPTADRHAGRWR